MKKSKYRLANTGRTCKKVDSPKIQKGISKWRTHVDDRSLEDCSKMRYWQTVSSCAAL